jgi:hypothetical protein
MMDYWGYGYNMNGMMWANGLAGLVIWLVVFTDLVLLGIWLWKLISKR